MDRKANAVDCSNQKKGETMKPIFIFLICAWLALSAAALILIFTPPTGLGEKYVVGVEKCDGQLCITPLSISKDRLSGRLLVKQSDMNETCVQDINHGDLVPLSLGSCRSGLDWDGNQETKGPGLILG